MRINLKGNGNVTIDGRSFTGRSVTIVNDKVVVDGVEQDGQLVGPVSVTVNGDADVVDNPTGTVTVTGAVGTIKTMSGDVHCKDVSGSVSTMSGDVTCGSIGGSASTMSGDINRR